MKAVFNAVLIVLLLASCGQFVPVKGTYQRGPYSIDTQKSKDEIWENLMDLITKNALSVTLLDKASGVLIVGPTAIEITRELGSYDKITRQRSADEAPQLQLKDAAGVSGYTYRNGSFSYPETGVTRWNVRVRDSGDSRTVSVVLYGQRTAAADAFEQAGRSTPLRPTKLDGGFQVYSTGYFERTIAETITR